MPELDTIRGIAVLGVLFLHGFAWQYGGFQFGRAATLFLKTTELGSQGVNLFFVLSGFLITGILVDSRQAPRFYTRFYTRRALRILPAYYALLTLLWALHSSSGAFVGLSFVYLANLTGFFGVACDYGPLWSLAVEEHFYLLWPAMVRNLSAAKLLVVSCAIVVFVPALRLICFLEGWGSGSLGWYTWFVADGLAMGGVLAIALRRPLTRSLLWKLCGMAVLLSLALAVAGAPFGIATKQRPLGAALQQTTVSLLFTGFLLLFLLLGTSRFQQFVNNRVLRFFGYISYGLYLVHLLAFRLYDRVIGSLLPQLVPSNSHFGLVVLRFVIAATGAIVTAYLSRKYFEESFLRLKDRFGSEAVTASAVGLNPETADSPVST